MNKLAILIAAFATVLRVSDASAGPCDAHFPLDGNLTDVSGNGYHGLPIVKGGKPGAVQFAEGKFGRALHVNPGNAVRAFVDLHYELCPQVTITAWFRLESLDFDNSQYVVSTGAGSGPGIRAYSRRTIMLDAVTASGVSIRDAIRDPGKWYFVAAVYDYNTGKYWLHWGERVKEGVLQEKRRPPEDSFWIGAYNDSLSGTAQNMYIDDVRIHGRLLTEDEIAALAMSDTKL